MGSFLSPANLQGIGTVGYNTYQQTASSLAGNPQLVHFLSTKTGACIFQFDAVINETHGSENQVTSFPVEDGSTVTDHIIVTPLELTVQGVITDSPIGSASALLQEAITTGLTAVAPPLIIAAAGTAYAYAAQSNLKADQGTGSPSVTAFNKLYRLQNGDDTVYPPVPPSLVHVNTKMRVYMNMAIKSLSVPRDRTVSNAIVVQVGLIQLNLVAPQTISISALANPELAGKLADEGPKAVLTGQFVPGLKSGLKTVAAGEKILNQFLGRSP